MEEKSRKFLYKQLLEMDSDNKKENAEQLMPEIDFFALSDAEALRYIFYYRDNQTNLDDGDGVYQYCIEIPDMDLEGQDLSGLRIKCFTLRTLCDDESYRVSSVNLKNTNATIDLAYLVANSSDIDENGLEYKVIDFSKSNFEGCNVYGILPDEYENDQKTYLSTSVITLGKERLGERYLNRRRIHHQSEEKKEIADRAYYRLMSLQSLKGMKGINQTQRIDLMDYDFGDKDEDELTQILANVRELEIYKGKGFRVIFPVEAHQEKIYQIMEKTSNPKISSEILEFVTLKQYELGNLEFLKKYYKEINRNKLIQIVESELEKGNLEFVDFFADRIVLRNKTKLDDLRHRKKMQDASRNADSALFEKHFLGLTYKEQQRVIKEEYEKGNLEFIEQYFDMAEDTLKNEIAISEYRKNNIRFITSKISLLNFDTKDYIIKSEYNKKNMNFVEKNFIKASMELQEELMFSEIENKNWRFVKLFYTQFSKKYKDKFFEKAWEIGGKEFVKANFKECGKKLKAIVLNDAYTEGDLKFIEAHYYSGNDKFRMEVMISEYKKGNKKFVESHYNAEMEAIRMTIGTMAYQNQDDDFLEEKFDDVPDAIRNAYLEKLYNEGDMNKVTKFFSKGSLKFKKKVVSEAFYKGNNQLLNRYFSESDTPEQVRLISEEEAKGNYEFVNLRMDEVRIFNGELDFPGWYLQMMKEGTLSQRIIGILIEKEKSAKVCRGKKIVPLSGFTLQKAISKDYDIKTISQLIQAGSNVNYYTYKNENRIVEYKPILHYASEIQDAQKRKVVLKLLLEKNANPKARHVEIDYILGTEKEVTKLDAEEIEEIQAEIAKERREKNEQYVKAFLRNEIGLTEEQENQLAQRLLEINIDIYSWTVEGDLRNRKILLDKFGTTKQAFTIHYKSLSQSLEVLYSRAMFFNEEGIRVKPSNFIYTLGTDKKTFAEKYGQKIIKKETEDKTTYVYNVRKTLIRKYKLPMTQEEFEKNVKEIDNKERGNRE